MSACDEEPCKSLIDQYWAKAIDAQGAELAMRLHCDVWKAATRGWWMLFALWFAAFAQAAACAALHLPPVACTALTILSFALLAALAAWGVRILWLRRLVRAYEKACRDLFSEMLSLRRQIAVRCPRECQPQAVTIRTSC